MDGRTYCNTDGLPASQLEAPIVSQLSNARGNQKLFGFLDQLIVTQLTGGAVGHMAASQDFYRGA